MNEALGEYFWLDKKKKGEEFLVEIKSEKNWLEKNTSEEEFFGSRNKTRTFFSFLVERIKSEDFSFWLIK